MNDDPKAKTVEYRTFPDTFTKVEAHFSGSLQGPAWFRAVTKSGREMRYGEEASGRVMATGGVVRSWWVTRVADRVGNAMTVRYRNDQDGGGHTVQHAPLRIDYTSHPQAAASRAVDFVIGMKDERDRRQLFSGGMRLDSSWQLDRIRMLGPGDSLVREYVLTYFKNDSVTGRTRLKQVKECAADGVCKPSTRFTWYGHEEGEQGFDNHEASQVPKPESWRAGVMLLDVTGDGLDDLVIADTLPPGQEQLLTTDWRVAPSFGFDPAAASSLYMPDPVLTGWYDQPHPNALDGEVQPEIGTPIDYDQDGRTDLLLHDIYGAHATWQVLRSLPQHGFQLVDTGIPHVFPAGAVPPFPVVRFDTALHLADVTGDGVSDMVQCVYDEALLFSYWKLYPWSPDVGPTGGFDPSGYLITELEWVPCYADVRTVDIDADSRVDLLVQHFVIDPIYGQVIAAGTEYDALHFLSTTTVTSPPMSLWLTKDPELGLPPAGQPVVFLDVNGDGLADAVMPDSSDLTLTTWINDGTKFLPPVNSLAGAIPGVDEAAHFRLAVPIDYNEDGRQDLLMPMGEANVIPKSRILRATGSIGSGTFVLEDASVAGGIPVPTSIIEGGIELWHPRAPRVTDIDGDGVQDIVAQTDFGFTVWKNRLAEEDRLASATDGLNGFGASQYARLAVQGFGDAPYTIVQTTMPNGTVPSGLFVDRGIPTVVVPNTVLPWLGQPVVLPSMPIP